MSPQKQLSNFIDTLLLSYVLDEDHNVKSTIIEEYRKLNEKCDNIISKMKERRKQSQPA